MGVYAFNCTHTARLAFFFTAADEDDLALRLRYRAVLGVNYIDLPFFRYDNSRQRK